MSKEFEKTIVYSALEVANICGVANQTAINWIRNGYLKAYSTPGGQYRVYADDLVGFMMERNMRVPENLASLCNTSSNSSILVVEDDRGFNTVLHQYLSREFSDVQVYQAICCYLRFINPNTWILQFLRFSPTKEAITVYDCQYT